MEDAFINRDIDVFISHDMREDKKIAQLIRVALKEKGISFWCAPESNQVHPFTGRVPKKHGMSELLILRIYPMKNSLDWEHAPLQRLFFRRYSGLLFSCLF